MLWKTLNQVRTDDAQFVAMKILCVICSLWLVEPQSYQGEVYYFCERCASGPPPLKPSEARVSNSRMKEGLRSNPSGSD